MNWRELDAIIFDLGGVIINLDYQLTQQAFIDLGLENFGSIYSQLQQESLFDRYETGKISSQHFINELLRAFPKPISANKIVSAWNAMILDVPQEKLALLERLRIQKKLFLLSNTNEIHMEKVRRSWSKTTEQPMENFFDKMYLSHEIGMRKPTAEIFHHVLNEQGIDAAKTLFIDDTSQHIEGAKAIGLHTYHLENANSLLSLFS